MERLRTLFARRGYPFDEENLEARLTRFVLQLPTEAFVEIYVEDLSEAGTGLIAGGQSVIAGYTDRPDRARLAQLRREILLLLG